MAYEGGRTRYTQGTITELLDPQMGSLNYITLGWGAELSSPIFLIYLPPLLLVLSVINPYWMEATFFNL